MTGTGTQTDPYVVENYTDFCSMTGGNAKYYKLSTDIDFSKLERTPDESPITISFKELDGDGHTISNYFRRENNSNYKNSFFKSSTEISFRNLNFNGIYLAGGLTEFVETPYPVRYENCRIGVKIVDTYTAYSTSPFFGAGIFTDCEILFEGQSKFTKLLNGKAKGTEIFSGCLIKLNLEFDNPTAGTVTAPFFGRQISFSGIIGKVKCISQNAQYQLFSGSSLCSYYAVDFNTATSISAENFDGTNFYDSEVMINVADKMPADSHFYALTTAQCKDAEYLQSIGFPCISGVIT